VLNRSHRKEVWAAFHGSGCKPWRIAAYRSPSRYNHFHVSGRKQLDKYNDLLYEHTVARNMMIAKDAKVSKRRHGTEKETGCQALLRHAQQWIENEVWALYGKAQRRKVSILKKLM